MLTANILLDTEPEKIILVKIARQKTMNFMFLSSQYFPKF